jgi:Ni,Fe-hydrogenase III large subunit
MNAFTAAVAARSRTGIPLGAYASDGAIHYCFLEPYGVTRLSTRVDPAIPVAALGPEFPIFAWDEREMADERGIAFAGLADPRPFRAHDGTMPPAIVAHGTGVMHVVVGPVHAGIIEPGRFTFSSGGETVVHLDAQLGYAHRGVERALEGRSALGAAPLVARICGSCSASRAHAYALALESLAGIAVPPAAAFARLVLCELERIVNHLADLAACSSAAGWMPGFVRGMALKERAMRVCAVASGHRLLFDAIVPGGVAAHALTDAEAVAVLLADLERDVLRYLDALFANGGVVSRWRGAGIVSHAMAAACGAVGPAHRASGGTVDVRHVAPYGAYREVAFATAGAHRGDVFARCRVKRAELHASFELLAQALRALFATGIPATLPMALASGIGLGCVEGARGAELVAVHVDEHGDIARFHAISASYRNWPIEARAMDGNIIPDFPLVSKSFNLCYACADR